MDDLPYLVTAAQGGDLAAFAALIGRYQDLAFAAAYARLGDAYLAQDAAQEAFLQAHRDLPMLREPGADVDDATPGETPLDRAVIMHDVPMVELLVEHGATRTTCPWQV